MQVDDERHKLAAMQVITTETQSSKAKYNYTTHIHTHKSTAHSQLYTLSISPQTISLLPLL